jgi:hypothetical protein
MLVETDIKTFHKLFPVDPHPFISELFIELNKGKTERVVRLIDDIERPVIGLIAGIRNGMLQSPFSAPFGGFSFLNENIYISEIDRFIDSLKTYLISEGLKGVKITLPPDIYHSTFNAKTNNTLFRHGFRCLVPDITNWVNLQHFTGVFTQRNSGKYYRQAIKNGLSFELASDEDEKIKIYELICMNRERFNRPIFMTFNEIKETGNLWPVDFFKVCTVDKAIVASAIFYRNHPEIAYGVFWGDNEIGRPLRAIDFISFNLWSYYKMLGYKYLDLGISTESGNPNEGLLRFKECHEATSSLRHKFEWFQ